MTRLKNKRKATNQLRIIGGEWRGRKLFFPDVQNLRPTGDRIRETVFNWLQSDVIGAKCLDLFAGSGALGFEALSRGASEIIFLDSHIKSVQQLKENIKLLGSNKAHVIKQDALRWLDSPASTKYDIVFLDPPFGFDIVAEITRLLIKNNWLAVGAKIYLEQDANKEITQLPSNWELLKDKKAGQVRFLLYQA